MAFEGFKTVPDKASGEILRELDWDDYLKGNINSLMVPPACRLRAGTAWTISSSTVPTFGTAEVEFDTNGMFGTANPDRISVNTAGIYLVTATMGSANLSGTAGAQQCRAAIEKTGAIVAMNHGDQSVPSGVSASVSAVIAAGSGDYFRTNFTLSGTASLVTFSAIWQGGTA